MSRVITVVDMAACIHFDAAKQVIVRCFYCSAALMLTAVERKPLKAIDPPLVWIISVPAQRRMQGELQPEKR